ncbi:MAG: histidine-type phosphatase [Alistipes sp.]|nr:histidine-type phosphatase [Alistipes sp.]
MKRFIIILAGICFTISVVGQTTKERVLANPELALGVYRLYPTEFAEQTPVPKGYKPFYISHYGRHGSRYILRDEKFDRAYNVFADAEYFGKLTDFGKDVFERLKRAKKDAYGRYGELSLKGQEQHRQIAERMYNNYKDIFKKCDYVDAKSTIVPRVLISMTAFCDQLLHQNNKLDIHYECGKPFQKWLNPYYKDNDPRLAAYIDLYRHNANSDWVKEWREYRRKNVDITRLLESLFKKDYVKSMPFPHDFVFHLFKTATSLPGTPTEESILDVFTKEELYDQWRLVNAIFYHEKGPSGIVGGFLNGVSTPLLEKFIEDAEQKVAEGKPAVTLRFGHDGNIMGLLNTMRVPGWCEQVDDFDKIEEVWQDFNIPMGCNLQWIFYKNRAGDVLVKMLLNEEEIAFPIQSDKAPYYHWEDVRKYYRELLPKMYEQGCYNRLETLPVKVKNSSSH